MASIVKSFAIWGVDGYPVDVETKTIEGQPLISIVGLGDTAVKEARERVEAALRDGHFRFPEMKVVINLAPGDLKKSGSHFDLPIALGLLMESDQLHVNRWQDFGCIGELSLNARLRSCTGVLPMVIAAKQAGIKNIIVPRDNIHEASLVQGINVVGFDYLREVVQFLEGEKEYTIQPEINFHAPAEDPYSLDFNEVQGQEAILEYIVVAAAGGHNLLMIGSPGCGKSMIAKRIPTILPSLTEQEALETTKIYSVAGMLKGKGYLIKERPFRAPHHNASTNALIGGGKNAIPGEISLAHNGVLFLDEIAEFSKKTLDALRQPMEDQEVTISRVKYSNTYPASFMLVAAMNPCPCGYFGDARKACVCSGSQIHRYRSRVSGPLLDRMDIHIEVPPVTIRELSLDREEEPSERIQRRVAAARALQEERFRDRKIYANSQMAVRMVKRYCPINGSAGNLLEKAVEKFGLSPRAYHRILKVARTIADLEDSNDIKEPHIAEAIQYRVLDKRLII